MKKYDPPMSIEEIEVLNPSLLNCPIHRWRAETGIELIHDEPTIEEQIRIWENWQLMDEEQKKISEKKSIELFGITNEEHHSQLMENGEVVNFGKHGKPIGHGRNYKKAQETYKNNVSLTKVKKPPRRKKLNPRFYIVKHKLQNLLSQGNWKVTFWKINGDKRVMNCTRNFKFVQKNSRKWITPKGIRITPLHLMLVWDLDKNNWRCFRLSSIIKIEKNNERLAKKIILNNFNVKTNGIKLFYNNKGMINQKKLGNFSVNDLYMVEFEPEDLFLEIAFKEISLWEFNDFYLKLKEKDKTIIKEVAEYYIDENLDEDCIKLQEGAITFKKWVEMLKL